MAKAEYILAGSPNTLFEPGKKLCVHVRCPGCGQGHYLTTAEANSNIDDRQGPIWDFNGNLDKPTFSPSILSQWPWHNEDGSVTNHICHSYIKDGRIQFLSDCTHSMAGQTIDLPDL